MATVRRTSTSSTAGLSNNQDAGGSHDNTQNGRKAGSADTILRIRGCTKVTDLAAILMDEPPRHAPEVRTACEHVMRSHQQSMQASKRLALVNLIMMFHAQLSASACQYAMHPSYNLTLEHLACMA